MVEVQLAKNRVLLLVQRIPGHTKILRYSSIHFASTLVVVQSSIVPESILCMF